LFRTVAGKRLVNMSDGAHALADHSSGKNVLVNFVGGITLIVALPGYDATGGAHPEIALVVQGWRTIGLML
jgi:hypothetical protein